MAKNSTRIFIVRHGKSARHSGKIFLGQADIPLSEQGLDEAAAAGKELKRLGAKPERIYASDLIRAKVTAEIIAEQLGGVAIMPDMLLREMDMGTWDGELIEDIKAKFPEEYVRRGDNIRNYRTPGGENFYELHGRVTREFHRIFSADFSGEKRSGDLIIVAHLGVLSALFEELTGEPAPHFPTGSVTEIPLPDWLK